MKKQPPPRRRKGKREQLKFKNKLIFVSELPKGQFFNDTFKFEIYMIFSPK